MVYIQARLVALLGLCLFASTVGSLPNDKMSIAMRRQALPPTIPSLIPDTKGSDPNNKSTTAQSQPETQKDAKQDKATDGTKSATGNNATQGPSSQNPAPPQTRTRRSASGQNKHVFNKRDYPGHYHGSGSRRNRHKSRPVYRHANRYRHGHNRNRRRNLGVNASPEPHNVQFNNDDN